MRIPRLVLSIIGLIQIANGAVLMVNPDLLYGLLGVHTVFPPWVGFVFLTAGARFIGYGIGMVAAARDPLRHKIWVTTMLGIQAVDAFAIVLYMADGRLPAGHVAMTAVLPALWVLVLSWVLWSYRGVEEGPAPASRPADR